MTSLNDLALPQTTAATMAREVASAYQSAAFTNHGHRVHAWAAAYARQHDITYDNELLYIAAMFHDIGLTPDFDNHTLSFEVAAGHVAHVFAAGAGWPRPRRERLSEVIIRHMGPTMDVAEDPESHLISRAAAVDVVGAGIDDFGLSFRAEVLRRYPRLGFTGDFLACFTAQADRKPDSSAAHAIRSDLATRIAANPLDTA
ncbi:HD domain-containing protein [Streptomyces sp. NPDC006552]|uniref:HD domain-containing protein n=1 Tax=Streptomyces sp. NPDC006552 TaxID=3157179 RepID=UPI0033B27C12